MTKVFILIKNVLPFPAPLQWSLRPCRCQRGQRPPSGSLCRNWTHPNPSLFRHSFQISTSIYRLAYDRYSTVSSLHIRPNLNVLPHKNFNVFLVLYTKLVLFLTGADAWNIYFSLNSLRPSGESYSDCAENFRIASFNYLKSKFFYALIFISHC